MNAPTTMATRQRDWWLLALRGLAAILFGIAAFAWPGLTIELLVIIFAVYALVDGVVTIVTYMRRGRETGSPSMLVQGIVSVLAGVIALIFPGAAALALLLLIAAWAILVGIAEIVLGIRFRERLSAEVLWVLAGVLSIAFGIALVVFPSAGALALVWLIGAYAILSGFLLVLLGLSQRAAVPAGAV